MARDLDKELSETDKTAEKPAEKEKTDKKSAKPEIKKASSKKPKKSIVKFFKDARSEFKKVSWPTPKQVINNTSVVLIMIVGAMLAIWGLDSLFLAILRFAFKID